MLPAGELGKNICDQETHTCKACQNGKFSSIPTWGYQQFEKFRNVTMKRNIYSNDPDNPPIETAWYFDLKDQDKNLNFEDILYNRTHITILSFNRIHAGYSKSHKAFNESKTGIVTVFFANVDYSIIIVSDYPKVSQVEKYHALPYDGPKDTTGGTM